MARKSKAADEKPAHTEPPSDGKKRKIDWSTVDDFQGFTIKSTRVKAASKKQKTATEADGTQHNLPAQNAPLTADVFQANPFPETELSAVHMKIEPANFWESTSRYRKFTSKSSFRVRLT
jgi:hypothetical protein